MGEKPDKTEGKKKKELPIGLAFVGFILLTRGLYLAWHINQTIRDFLGMYFVFMVFLTYFIASAGVFTRKKVGYYFGVVLLTIELALAPLFFPAYPLMMGFSFILVCVFLYLLIHNRGEFRDFVSTDKKVLIAYIVALILLLAWGVNEKHIKPTPEEYYEMVLEEAKEKNDVTICNKLQEGWRSECQYYFAIDKKALKVCYDIEDTNLKDSCFKGIAIRTKNSTLCDMIKNKYEKEDCYGQAKG